MKSMMEKISLLVIMAMTLAPGAFQPPVSAQTTQTVTVPAERYAAFIVPDPGASLTLTIKTAGDNEMVESHVVPEDTGDKNLWSPSGRSGSAPHVYSSSVILSSCEWLRIHGKCRKKGGGTVANIKYKISPTSGWTPSTVTLKIKEGASSVRSQSLGVGIGQQDTFWDGKNDTNVFVNTGTYDAVIEVVPPGGASSYVSSNHKIVVVDKLFKCWANASKTDLVKVIGETTESGLRSRWNSFVRANNIMTSTEAESDAAIAAGTTIPSTTLLDKILDVMADKETSAGGADGKASPLDIGPTTENSYSITQIRDVVMIDRGLTHQNNIDGNLTSKTTAVSFGEYLNDLATDKRSDVEECFKSSIKQMEWLDNYYVDTATHNYYQLGDNRESAEILAVGWNGGASAINQGFNGDPTWNLDDVGNADARAYADEVAGRAYP